MKKNLLYLSLFFLVGCSKSDTTPLSPASANFFYNVGANGNVSFSNISKNATTYQWSFGDGTTSYEQNPVHQYSNNANYPVTLTAKGLGGNDTQTQIVPVNTVRGSLLVYKSFSTGSSNIKVWVDNIYVGLIVGAYYYSAAPSCGNAYSVTALDLSMGTHSVSAKEDAVILPKSWSTTVNISAGCNSLGLK